MAKEKTIIDKPKDNITFFVATSPSNYLKNFIFSSTFAGLFTYVAYLKEFNVPIRVFVFLYAFFILFRTGEILLTKKSLVHSLYLFGRVTSSKEVRVDLTVLMIILIAIFIGILVVKPV